MTWGKDHYFLFIYPMQIDNITIQFLLKDGGKWVKKMGFRAHIFAKAFVYLCQHVRWQGKDELVALQWH